jgi:hydrogenase maturation protein HypF
MVADLAAAERLAIVDASEGHALTSRANPIVILQSRGDTSVAPEVTERLDTIGLMLPTTPLHDELVRRFGRALVVTSGNGEGDPLAFDPATVRHELAGIADLWLDHDRPIVRPVDDSVVRVIAGRVTTVRLARGLAPLPLELSARPMLALGGHQKAAIALCNGAQSILAPHVGDLETESTRARYLDHVQATCALYGAAPELAVCDQHPDYFTTRWAGQQATPVMAVQHHHAHVAAAMLERGWLDRQVLGVAWDGTGCGPDGTIWGGEFLLATAADFRRVACLRPFALPGGEMAVRQPWRVAVALVYQALGAESAASLRFAGVTASQVEQIVRLLAMSYMWPATSSAGRLFDAVAALTLDVAAVQFEGQAAMLLEAACEPGSGGTYPLPLAPGEPAMLDWRPLVRGVLADRRAGISPRTIAMRFHRALAQGIVAITEQFPALPVALCGGCFQNRVLTELVVERLAGAAHLATPNVIPSGDGGLAAGQLAVAAARLERGC